MRRRFAGVRILSARDIAIGLRPARGATRRGVISAVVVGIGIVLATAPTTMSATHRQKVDPFAAGWTVTGKDSGYCQSSAVSTKRSDAFRCFYGSFQIYDPCFSSAAVGGVVRCVVAPWSRKAFEVQMTKPLPAAGAGLESIWGVALANGGRCSITPESTDTSHAHVIGWTCTNGDLAQGLHSGTTWWALWQPSSGVPWKHVSIRTLYR